MAFNGVFPLNLYWSSSFELQNGTVSFNNQRADTSISIDRVYTFSEFVDVIYDVSPFDRNDVHLSLALVWTDVMGYRRYIHVRSDETVLFIYSFANYCLELYIHPEPIFSVHSVSTSAQYNQQGHNGHSAQYNQHGHDGYSSQYNQQGRGTSDDGSDEDSSDFSEENNDSSYHWDSSDSEDYVPSDESDYSDDNDSVVNSSSRHYVYDNISGWDKSQCVDDLDAPIMWDGNVNNITIGVHFKSKEAAIAAVTDWSTQRAATYRTLESKSTRWVVECVTRGPNYPQERLRGTFCNWKIRVSKQDDTETWKVVRWVDSHNCPGANMGNEARNVTSKIIAQLIVPLVREEPWYKVKLIQTAVHERYKVDVTYKKAWHGRRKAIESVFGNWENSFADLPNFMEALRVANPGTRIRYKFSKGTKNMVNRSFKYVFWAFGPSVQLFHACFPVVSIDATHLRGSYKGKLIVATAKNANNNIVPIAFALVDEETLHSWKWFLKYLKEFVLGDRKTCIISDRHQGILSAIEWLFVRYPGMGVHRFCLQHIRTNLSSHFPGKRLRSLCLKVGKMLQKRKYEYYWQKLYQKNEDAADWLRSIDLDKWTLFYDDCHRWNHSTTNMSESYNNVLKGIRHLPITALVEATFEKTVNLFQESIDQINNCQYVLAPEPMKTFNKYRMRAPAHRVSRYDRDNSIYRVKTAGGNIQIVKYRARECSYPDDSRLIHHDGPGRRRVNRIKGGMDYGVRRRVQLCSRCRGSGHNARSCPVSHPTTDRRPLDQN